MHITCMQIYIYHMHAFDIHIYIYWIQYAHTRNYIILHTLCRYTCIAYVHFTNNMLHTLHILTDIKYTHALYAYINHMQNIHTYKFTLYYIILYYIVFYYITLHYIHTCIHACMRAYIHTYIYKCMYITHIIYIRYKIILH